MAKRKRKGAPRRKFWSVPILGLLQILYTLVQLGLFQFCISIFQGMRISQAISMLSNRFNLQNIINVVITNIIIGLLRKIANSISPLPRIWKLNFRW